MDQREQLSELIHEKASITDNDKVIIKAFEKIASYLEPVKKDVENSKLDKSDYNIVTDKKGATIRVGDKNLYFFDKENHIKVVYYDDDNPQKDFDSLLILDGQVKSKKYDEFLTDELLGKYLELFF